jgi:hypothetical protein
VLDEAEQLGASAAAGAGWPGRCDRRGHLDDVVLGEAGDRVRRSDVDDVPVVCIRGQRM